MHWPATNAMGWNDDLTKAEAEIEQKDAEIAELKQSKRFELIRKIREKADKDTYALAEECVRLEKELTEANAEIARLTKVIKDANDEN